MKFWTHGEKYNLRERLSEACSGKFNKMLALSCLIYMNDKTKVKEVITTSRFIFMEGFVTCPALPKPHKMIEKFPTVIRSRLQAWSTNKMLDAMSRIVAQGGFHLQTKDGQVIWPTIFNPYSGVLLDNPFQLTALFYLGYPKNKMSHLRRMGPQPFMRRF